ncbi:hypothetical protein ACFLQI_01730 [Candidatus Undinarchaeota archaeon]
MDALLDESDAEEILHEIGCQKEGIDIMLPKAKFRLIFLENVNSGTANIVKQEMLSVGGDAAVAVGTVTCKVPETNILLMGTLAQYKRVVEKLGRNVLGCPDIAKRIEKTLE